MLKCVHVCVTEGEREKSVVPFYLDPSLIFFWRLRYKLHFQLFFIVMLPVRTFPAEFKL